MQHVHSIDKIELDHILDSLGLEPAGPDLVPLSAGRSGADSYAVQSGPRRLVLRAQPNERFPGRLARMAQLQQLAADRGLAPEVLYVDAKRRWMLSAHVAGRPLSEALASDDERTILGRVGRRLGELHALRASPEPDPRTPTTLTQETFESAAARYELPDVAKRAWDRFAARPPRVAATSMLCHHDLNPTNVLVEGQSVCFVDWETAGIGDGAFDVATLVNLLLLTPTLTERLLQSYEETALEGRPSPEALSNARRLAYLAYGITFLDLVRTPPSHAGEVPTLAECYQDMRRGKLDTTVDAGRWRVGCALLQEYLRMP